MRFLVFIEQRDGKIRKASLEALSLASKLAGGSVAAVLPGNGVVGLAGGLGKYGAGVVYVADQDILALYSAMGYVGALDAAATKESPDAVLIAATAMGKDMAPRLAARRDVSVLADVMDLQVESGRLVGSRPVYSGKARAEVDCGNAALQVITTRPNVFPAEPREAGQPRDETLDLPTIAPRARVISVEASESRELDVSEADIIVSGGRGIKAPENWPLVRDLQGSLGAALGASRAVVDAGWIDHQYQVGLSGRLAFAILVLFAILVFVYSASRRIRLLLALGPEPRFDRIGRRIGRTLEYAFAQKRMFRDLYAGVFHIFLFTGFLVLLVRTIALVAEGLVPGFVLLPGRAGDVYTLAKDVFEVLVLIGVTMAVVRRAFARPKRLDLTADAWLILFLIFLLVAADLVSEGARVALHPQAATAWSPAVLVLSGLVAGLTASTLQALYEFCWWIHLVDILFFGNYLPYSKHFHILTAIPNVFFMKLEPMGRLGTPDLENSAHFGASRVEHLSWKSALDGYTCTECGRCRVVCPTALTAKPLDPKVFIGDLRDAVYEATPQILAAVTGRGNGSATPPRKELIGGWISEETIWACTRC